MNHGNSSILDLRLFIIFNKHLDEDINWFFENMIDSTTYIDYKISKKMENIFLRTLDHFNAMAEVAYYDGDNQEISRIWVRPNKNKPL